MIFDFPFTKTFTITQGFAQNKNTYYAEDGLVGHTGLDIYKFHKAPVHAVHDAYCYLVTPSDDPMKYTAVYTIVEDSGLFYEVSYGHLDSIFATVGNIKRGQVVGLQGNKGDVASGGVKITREMKEFGSSLGTHLHFQVRLIKKVTAKDKTKKYIFGGNKINGAYYEIVDYTNGTKGCIDPEPFLCGNYPEDKVILTSTLKYGSRGEQVKLLQTKLKITSDGIFGQQTDREVRAFQKKYNLVVDGIVGPKTRQIINNL